MCFIFAYEFLSCTVMKKSTKIKFLWEFLEILDKILQNFYIYKKWFLKYLANTVYKKIVFNLKSAMLY